MNTVEVVPGLIVDEEMFGAAAAGLAAHAPQEKLTWEAFTVDDQWLVVPGPDGAGYKAEYVVRREPDRTVKINLWFAPDVREGDKPAPHNHPWPFTAHILLGGYTEQRYELADGKVSSSTQIHRTGGTNTMPLSTYHEVTNIESPGRTLTLMLCGQGRQGAWGYLDPQTGATRDNETDPGFKAKMAALNPRLR